MSVWIVPAVIWALVIVRLCTMTPRSLTDYSYRDGYRR